jgi:hypothetical protein
MQVVQGVAVALRSVRLLRHKLSTLRDRRDGFFSAINAAERCCKNLLAVEALMNYPLVAIPSAVVPWKPPERNVGPSRRPQAPDLIVVDRLPIRGKSAYRYPWGRRDLGKPNAAEPGRYVDIWV